MSTAAGAMSVVGTAGHIDHGKSALVKALTGQDPDRLAEEKRRGMTIDLGFAFLDLASGRQVGIIDVPGHRRFLKNMLAGVHGIDAVILVVAADEGPMPQTHEHLAILDLLGVRHGVIAITKVDLVDAEWLDLVEADVRRALRGRPLAAGPIVRVSSVSGEGLDQLRAALDAQLELASPRLDVGRPRLWVDRAFTIAGFGTVVTGTLVGGALNVGDELTLLPQKRRVRVRGLHQHNQAITHATPGARTAVNLAGVERRDVGRGEMLVKNGAATLTRRIDARLRVLESAPRALKHRSRLTLYQGTAEVPVELLLLRGDRVEPGGEALVQLYVATPVPARNGDRFILRQPSPAVTLAGGVMVDVAARRHRRDDPVVLSELAARQGDDAGGAVVAELARHRVGMTRPALAQRLGLTERELAEALGDLLASQATVELGGQLLAPAAWRAMRSLIDAHLRDYHAANPLRAGMPREELRSRTALAPALFSAAISELVQERVIREEGGEVALVDHRPRLGAADEAAAAAAVAEIDAGGFAPPSLPDLVARHHLKPAVLQYLLAQGRIVRLDADTGFGRHAFDMAVGRIKAHLASNGRMTVAQARDLLGSSRRYVLPLLEYLDAQKITRRVGDDRILRG